MGPAMKDVATSIAPMTTFQAKNFLQVIPCLNQQDIVGKELYCLIWWIIYIIKTLRLLVPLTGDLKPNEQQRISLMIFAQMVILEVTEIPRADSGTWEDAGTKV